MKTRWLLIPWAVGLALSAPTYGEPTLSLDGTSISSIPVISPAGPGDVLEATPGVPPPPLDFPSIVITADLLGIDGPLGPQAGAVFPDLDAMSFGRTLPLSFSFDLKQDNPQLFHHLVDIYFSVNRAALGAPGSAVDGETFVLVTPSFARVAAEPGADVFTSGLNGTNAHVYDGDGEFATVPGLGLNEGIIATPEPPPLPGKAGVNPDTNNLDALDLRPAPPQGEPVFFSVDTTGAAYLSLLPDLNPALTPGAISPADVLVSRQDGTFSTYATAEQLGLTTLIAAILDPITGAVISPETIDRTLNNIDALVVFDDGILDADLMPFFDPASDIILFSLDQSSALVQNRELTINGLLNPFIVAGDILISGNVAGMLPQILVTAEELGLFVAFGEPILGQTIRLYSDELDALDVVVIPEPTTFAMLGLMGVAALRRRRPAQVA